MKKPFSLLCCAFIVIGLVVIYIGSISSTDNQFESNSLQPGPEGDDAADIIRAAGIRAAKKYIGPTLQSPSTTKWNLDSVTFTETTPVGDMRCWDVKGVVDTTNSAGAAVSYHWTASLLASGGKLFARSVSVNDNTIFPK